MTIKKPLFVAVTGGSGSGKTTVARRLREHCSDLDILTLQQDHYYRDLSHLPPASREEVNFDHPASIDFDLVFSQLSSLSKGMPVERPTYDFKSHERENSSVPVAPQSIILFDGILALHDVRVRSLFDLTLFVDVTDDVRFIRRLRRDVEERGRTIDGVIKQYLSTVRPMYDAYVAPTRRFADFVIPWDQYNDRAIHMLGNMLQKTHESHQARQGNQ